MTLQQSTQLLSGLCLNDADSCGNRNDSVIKGNSNGSVRWSVKVLQLITENPLHFSFSGCHLSHATLFIRKHLSIGNWKTKPSLDLPSYSLSCLIDSKFRFKEYMVIHPAYTCMQCTTVHTNTTWCTQMSRAEHCYFTFRRQESLNEFRFIIRFRLYSFGCYFARRIRTVTNIIL